MAGFGSFGTLPYASLSLRTTPTIIQQLIDQATIVPVYGMALDTVDGNGNTETIYLSDVGFTSSSNDTPADTHFDGALQQAIRWRRSVRTGSRLGGRGLFRSGEVTCYAVGTQTVNNTGKSLFELVNERGVDGQPCEIRWGQSDLRWETWSRLFGSTASGWEITDLGVINIKLRGIAFRFDQPLMDNRYAGTGDEEGGEDLKDKPKPVALGGLHRNVPVPELFGSTRTLIFDLHNLPNGPGSVESVDAVFDRSIALTRADSGPGGDGDFDTFSDLKAATTGAQGSGADIESGEFATCLAEGYIRLGSIPSGIPTVDFTGGVFGGSTPKKPGSVAEVVAKIYGGLGTTDVNTTTINTLDTEVPYDVERWYGPQQEVSLGEVLDDICGGVEGFWGDSTQGRFEVGTIKVPSTPFGSVQKEITERDIISARYVSKPSDVKPAVDEVQVSYARNYNVQDSGLDANITDTRLAFVTEPWRTVEQTTSRPRHSLAKRIEVETPFVTETAASAHANRLLDLYASQRKLVELKIGHRGYDLDIGRKVRVTLARAGINDEVMLIVGITFDAQQNTTILVVYN